MVLLDGGRHDARHADAIAAHQHDRALALLVEHRGVHRLAVLAAELEDVPDLDAAGDAERAPARRAGVAGHDVAQVHRLGFGQVAAPVDAGEVRVALVGAADEVRQVRGRVVGIDLQLEPDGAEEAGLAAGGGADRSGVAMRSGRARPAASAP